MTSPDAIFRRAQHQCTVHSLNEAPDDRGYEIAFAGRSNAGKSSVINTLTSIARLARTSKTPGRTRQIIFFELDEDRRLVDLPGYGYARTSKQLQEHWAKVLPTYFKTRRSLKGVVLVMDIRHPLKPLDQRMLDWCDHANLPVHTVLTKADKLSRGKADSVALNVRSQLSFLQSDISVQSFSSTKRLGKTELCATLNRWLLTEEI